MAHLPNYPFVTVPMYLMSSLSNFPIQQAVREEHALLLFSKSFTLIRKDPLRTFPTGMFS
jgi:hypothetical protein